MSSSTDPMVLGMINKSLNDIGTDVKEIKTKLGEGALAMNDMKHGIRNLETKVEVLEDGQKKIKKTLYDHTESDEGKKKHYMQGFTETFTQRTWRRKDILFIATAITTTITFIIQYWAFQR